MEIRRDMKEYEAIDIRYDEGVRGRVESDVQPTIAARDPKCISGGGAHYGKRDKD